MTNFCVFVLLFFGSLEDAVSHILRGLQKAQLDGIRRVEKGNVTATFTPEQKNIYCYLKQELSHIYTLKEPPPQLAGQKSSCAVVSSSGGLLRHRFGKDIDKHDVVMRFNLSPTQMGYPGTQGAIDYTDYVGSRTDFRLGFFFAPGEANRCLNKVLSSPFVGNPGFRACHAILKSLYPTRMGYSARTENPTSGFYGMLLALSNCAHVDAYEMTPSEAAMSSPAPYQYYSDVNVTYGVHGSSNHGFIRAEHDLWARLSSSPASSGKTSFPGFARTDCPPKSASPGNLEEVAG